MTEEELKLIENDLKLLVETIYLFTERVAELKAKRQNQYVPNFPKGGHETGSSNQEATLPNDKTENQ